MDQNTENLTELVTRFYEEPESTRVVGDIAAGDELLGRHRAPEPDVGLIAAIKGQINARLMLRDRRIFHPIVQRVAIAACLMIIALVGMRFMQTQPVATGPAMAALNQIWADDSDPLSEGDMQFALLTAEVDEIDDSILRVRLDEWETDSESAVSELEMEIADINTDFWKG
ncbi:MAG: hypothetical protein KAT00_11225 [Planctomycetes bacterium]|nr:hypothetical protein [Planctomycetota bacterium]